MFGTLLPVSNRKGSMKVLIALLALVLVSSAMVGCKAHADAGDGGVEVGVDKN